MCYPYCLFLISKVKIIVVLYLEFLDVEVWEINFHFSKLALKIQETIKFQYREGKIKVGGRWFLRYCISFYTDFQYKPPVIYLFCFSLLIILLVWSLKKSEQVKTEINSQGNKSSLAKVFSLVQVHGAGLSERDSCDHI